MNRTDSIFTDSLDQILDCGVNITTRNDDVRRDINHRMVFTTTPLVTIRKTFWKGALREMEFFMGGKKNVKHLHPSIKHWWEPFTNKNGDLVGSYGQQMRYFSGFDEDGFPDSVDQIEYLIDGIKNHPYSRRLIMTTWHAYDMIHNAKNGYLTNCHGSLTQFSVNPDNSLHMSMTQRSCDMMLGVPHNIIQYWALLMYMAHKTGRNVGSFTWVGNDCHIYKDHLQCAAEMISTTNSLNIKYGGMSAPYSPPQERIIPNLVYTPTSDEFKADDFSFDGEIPKPLVTTKLKMSV